MSKVLLYDIETSPSLGYSWAKYDQNIIAFEEEWYMLSFSYKWLDEKVTHVRALPDYELYESEPHNDLQLVTELYNLFNESDIIIGHNSNSFDNKKSNARFAYHGFGPPSPYKEVDTLMTARKYFKFNSNKLDDLGDILGVGRKVKTGGFDLWLGCMKGDMKCWDRMKKYNKQDVVLLEKIYNKLRPWMNNHPNMALMNQTPFACPKCGSDNIHKEGTRNYTNVSYSQRYRCSDCGGWASDRIKTIDKSVAYVN